MKIIESLKNISIETLDIYRNLLFLLIVIDLVGVYWYLNQKKLGIALLIACILILGLIMFLSARKCEIKPLEKVNENKPNNIESLFKPRKQPIASFLPTAEEYEERLKKAF